MLDHCRVTLGNRAVMRASADPPTSATAWGLPQLMAGMQAVRSATARFVEQKFVQMLNQPLQIFRHADLRRAGPAAKADAGARSVPPDRRWRPSHGRSSRTARPAICRCRKFPKSAPWSRASAPRSPATAATLTRYYTATLSGDRR